MDDSWNFNFFKNEEDYLFILYLLGDYNIDELVEANNFRSVQKKVFEGNKAISQSIKNLAIAKTAFDSKLDKKYKLVDVDNLNNEKEIVQYYNSISDQQGKHAAITNQIKNELR